MGERGLQIVLFVSGVYQLVFGLLALIAPDTFFDQIGHYGVENSHYVGDVGAFYAAAGIGLLIAVWRPAWRVPLLWVGAVWYGLHALNHVFDVGEARSETRGWIDTLLIAGVGAGSAWLATVAARLQREGEGA